MITSLKVDSGVPPALYDALLKEVVEQPANDELKYGAGLRWVYQIVGGKYDGCLVSRITALRPTLKNSCGKMLVGMLGRPLERDDDIVLSQFIGKRFKIVVGLSPQSGVSRVDNVCLPDAPPF